ncbi:hypothetical protein [Variovorax saccharolyticus]|uniref:hypothetical protein n=1 Tax=Variovorax saccharolyticus TaxID=3053516 RepID=UPI00257552F2|nr:MULTISPECIES: hypothetical protein [unclassified Variovorax]MDM0016134.1 hypothetical protein [Variovorax sp. J22R187]MDM0027059.1 hypothetical protein [Variovorax sp. J31P216]
MRALLLLTHLAVIALAWYLTGPIGLLIAAIACFVLIAGAFAFSMARTEARESREMQRAMGRNTTFLAELLGRRER